MADEPTRDPSSDSQDGSDSAGLNEQEIDALLSDVSGLAGDLADEVGEPEQAASDETTPETTEVAEADGPGDVDDELAALEGLLDDAEAELGSLDDATTSEEPGNATGNQADAANVDKSEPSESPTENSLSDAPSSERSDGDPPSPLGAEANAESGDASAENIRSHLGLPALGSRLWRLDETPDILGPSPACPELAERVLLSNDDLLDAIRHLAYVQQERTLQSVNYRDLGSEELGSVHDAG